jgi:hypothetical protein
MTGNEQKVNGSELALKEPSTEQVALTVRDPEKELEFGKRCATALMSVVEAQPKKVVLNGKTYIKYEDWQMIARFFNATVGTEWTRPVTKNGAVFGFESRAVVYNSEGKPVSAAESSCLRDEPNWKIKPEFQLKSMAQTRASAKALRNVFSWIPVLAGYEATPAEEMEGAAIEQGQNVGGMAHRKPSDGGISLDGAAEGPSVKMMSEPQSRLIGQLAKDKGVASNPAELLKWVTENSVVSPAPTKWTDITMLEAKRIIETLMRQPVAVAQEAKQ